MGNPDDLEGRYLIHSVHSVMILHNQLYQTIKILLTKNGGHHRVVCSDASLNWSSRPDSNG